MTTPTEPLVRIVDGDLTEDGLAALTAVLLTRAAAAAHGAATQLAGRSHRHPRARWRRLERVSGYRSPVSWK